MDSTDLKIETSAASTAKIVGGKLTCIKTKRGRHGGGTWVDLFILLDAATKLDPAFKVRVYDTFIKGHILEYRDQSGDEYMRLCSAMNNNVLIDDPNDYKRVAKAIRFSVTGTNSKDCWNTATEKQLQHRRDGRDRSCSSLAAIFDLITKKKHLGKL